MNRPRKRDRHLPPCVYLRHGAYYLVRRGTWTRLAADLPGALREYARLAGRSTGGFPAFIDAMQPRIMRDRNTGRPKAAETRRQYAHCCALLREMLAELSPENITPRDIKTLRAELQDTPALANRTLTVLRLLLDEAVEDEIITSNPAASVDRIRVAARTRRITAVEYARIHAHADALLRAVMDLCYTTGQRVGDVLAIRSDAILDDGVYFRQQKTGRELVIGWSPDLRAAVAAARALKPNVIRAPYIWGHAPPTYTMVFKRWRAACVAAQVADAHIHDIRAMAATDARAQGIDPQGLLGHSDARTTRIYLRDKVLPVVAGPVMRRA